jgi:uncharacterized protein (TIGR02271 family)
MESATSTYDGWIGRDAYDAGGDRVGEITDIYYDDATGRPEWVAVKTGLFGTKRTFVPIHGSQPYGEGDLRLAFDKDIIKDAPRVDPEGHLSPEEERELWTHYGYDYADMTAAKEYGYGKAYGTVRADEGYDWRRGDTRARGTTDDTVTRSEEELHVAKGRTERKETGKVRLRKYVVTENVKMDVPVTREEVRVEREPVSGTESVPGGGKIRSGSRVGDIGEAEQEVVTYEERPVVTKETVPKEKIRLEKETVTDTETVEDQVRKEKVKIEGDAPQTQRRR